MKPTEKIENYLKNMNAVPAPDMDRQVLDAVLGQWADRQILPPAASALRTWRLIMKANTTKFAAAAVVIAAFTLIYQLTGSIDGANVAWADVVRKMNQVDHFHYTRMYYRSGIPSLSETGWYAFGKLYHRYNTLLDPYYIDDGQFLRGYDIHNNLIMFCHSRMKDANSPLDVITYMDWLYEYTASQFNGQAPEVINDDFLVYTFTTPQQYKEDIGIERFSFVVGKATLLPVQMNIYGPNASGDNNYSTLLFDYAQPAKPDTFFTGPTETLPSHGSGRLTFGGPEVTIQLQDVPYLSTVTARLKSKYDGPQGRECDRQYYELTGSPTYYLDITYRTSDGTPVLDWEDYPILLNLGTKSSKGRMFPDNTKKRLTTVHILKPTDNDDEFILEVNCWCTDVDPYSRD